MRPTLPILLCAALVMTGCSRIADSRINPLNWFDRGTVSAPVDGTGTIRPLVSDAVRNRTIDARGLVSTVSTLDIARTANGAIIRATGAAPAGAFNAQLVPVSQDAGTLTLAFRVEQGAASGGTQIVTAARLLDNRELASISRVTVQAAQNSASTAR